jgi:cell division protease FtsH
MNDTLGTIRYQANEEEAFLGHSARPQHVSEETAKRIDEEVKKLIDWAESKAREILTTHLEDLHRVSKALLEYETLSGDEVRALLRGENINRDDNNPPPAKSTPSKKSSVPTGQLPPGIEPQGT